METAHLEHVLEHTKSADFMDAANPGFYDPLAGLDYLQYPHSPYGISTMGLPPSSSPRLGFNSLNLSNGMSEYTYTSSPNYTTSPARELSSDSVGSSRSRRGSGAVSPTPSVPVGSLAAVPRSHRFNPIAATVTRSSTRQQKKRAKTGDDEFGSDDDEEFNPSLPMSNEARREEIRRQRIESEQRRRDELRDGYRRLKDALPVSNQKSSKVSLLDRATTHIRYLEMTQQQLQTRLAQAEAETARLRHVNEALMLGTAEQRHAAASAAVAAAQAQSTPAF
ncbi:BHLH domain-containing protein [Abortiporus biennis]